MSVFARRSSQRHCCWLTGSVAVAVDTAAAAAVTAVVGIGSHRVAVVVVAAHTEGTTPIVTTRDS